MTSLMMMYKTNYLPGDKGHVALHNSISSRLNRVLWLEDFENFQAAIDEMEDGDILNMTNSLHSVLQTVVINKSITIHFKGIISGQTDGYIFNVASDGVRLLGYAEIILNKGSGAIKITDAHRVSIKDIKINLNSRAGAIGIFHLGGWYADIENIYIPVAQSHANSVGLYIQGNNESDGSQGVYVSRYTNIVCKDVVIEGDNPRTVTTLTFINLDTRHITATLARAITLLQPVIQQTGGTSITLRSTHGFTAIGGDFEGSGTLYDIDNKCQGIFSYGNLWSGFNGTYMVGSPGAGGNFNDYSEHYPYGLTEENE